MKKKKGKSYKAIRYQLYPNDKQKEIFAKTFGCVRKVYNEVLSYQCEVDMDDYKRGGHTKFSLKAHLIFVTKYRKKVFQSQEISDDIKQSLYDVCNFNGYSILEMETDKDHIHILLKYDPKDSVSKIAHELKQHTTHDIWKRHSDYLQKIYWRKRILWSDGYFACSIGQVSQETITKYIQNQG